MGPSRKQDLHDSGVNLPFKPSRYPKMPYTHVSTLKHRKELSPSCNWSVKDFLTQESPLPSVKKPMYPLFSKKGINHILPVNFCPQQSACFWYFEALQWSKHLVWTQIWVPVKRDPVRHNSSCSLMNLLKICILGNQQTISSLTLSRLLIK